MIEISTSTTAVPGLWPQRQEELVYEFTKEPSLLRQYYSLYQQECRIVNDPKSRAADEDHFRRAHILIARTGGKCIGGGRLSICSNQQPKPLPMETDHFRVADYFPALKEPGIRYGEVSRLVLLPEFRHGRATLEMWKRFRDRVVDLELDVTYAAAPLINLRAYRKQCHSIGLDAKIHMDVVLPPDPGFEQITDYLLSCKAPEVKGKRVGNWC
jgi:hypothetical protein